MSRGRGYNVFFTHDAAVVDVGTETAPAWVHLRWVGSRAPEIRGEQCQTSVTNYFIGSDPKLWHSNVPNFARLRFHNVYAGVDIAYRGTGDRLEYDVVLQPGADLRNIAMEVDGATLTLRKDGALVMHTAAGDLVQELPAVYQERGGKRHLLRARFHITGKNRVSFEVPAYDRQRVLVIDPVLTYATYLGGSGFDAAVGVGVDSSGNIFTLGQTRSSNFLHTQPTGKALPDLFLVKLDKTDTHVLFATIIGGSAGDFPQALAVDSSGNSYITGITASPDFPAAHHFGTLSGDWGFVLKVNTSGQIVASAGLANVGLSSVAIDPSRNVYVLGGSESTSAPVTPGAYQGTLQGFSSAYLAKLSPGLGTLMYATYLGGNRADSGSGVAVDNTGHAYVMGLTTSTDFPTTPGAFQTVNRNPFGDTGDLFVTKFSANGSSLLYSTYLGGNADEDQNGSGGIAIDGSGNAYITGNTFSSDYPTTPGAFQTDPDGFSAFVSKLNPSGTALVYSTVLHGGSGPGSEGHQVAVDSSGNAYVIGTTGDVTFPIHSGFDGILRGPFIGQGQNDVFVAKFSPDGSKLLYSSYLGGTGFDDNAAGIALDASRNLYVAGWTNSTDFTVATDAIQKTNGGGYDGFVAKISIFPCALNGGIPSETICTPGDGATAKSPVRVIAGARDNRRVALTQVFIDGHKVYQQPLAAISTNLSLTPGNHRLTVQAQDSGGAVFKKSIHITVAP